MDTCDGSQNHASKGKQCKGPEGTVCGRQMLNDICQCSELTKCLRERWGGRQDRHRETEAGRDQVQFSRQLCALEEVGITVKSEGETPRACKQRQEGGWRERCPQGKPESLLSWVKNDQGRQGGDRDSNQVHFTWGNQEHLSEAFSSSKYDQNDSVLKITSIYL